MNAYEALVLGIVEGLTEYVPVSSTGHLLVAQALLGIESGPAATAYAIVIQAGAILAVLSIYRTRARRAMLGLVGRDPEGARLAFALGVAFLPAALVGLVAGDVIEAHLFGLWPVVGAWALGGFLILAVSPHVDGRRGCELDVLTLRMAGVVGLAQCVALAPGVSRSLATILGGVAAGMSLTTAVEFSFLLGVVTLTAASVYTAIGNGPALLDAYEVPVMVVGFVAAWVSAAIAVKWMVAWVGQRGLRLFGWWRLLAAATVGAALLAGQL